VDDNVFDAVARRYDRIRPGYPDEAIDALIHLAETRMGGEVLEIGAGTGQLSTALLARGYG
jgi:ubiquinone/menaquinone biosynthesis C-methylase UbiE